MLKYLPDHYYERLTGDKPTAVTTNTAQIIQKELKRFGLENTEDKNSTTCLPLPESFGTIEKELQEAYEPYASHWRAMLSLVTHAAPERPTSFDCPKGWSVWVKSKWVPLEALPDGKVMILDFETVKVSSGQWHPTCAVCMSARGWLVWLADFDKIEEVAVVPFSRQNAIMAYNANYDRARLGVEYELKCSENQWYDLMSMWIVTCGMSNQQRIVYKMHSGGQKADVESFDLSAPFWMQNTSTDSLSSVYEHYTGKQLDKGVRDNIVNDGLPWVSENMPTVIEYCLEDVLATHELAGHLMPAYALHRPSNISRYGAIALGSCFIPLDAERFPGYYDRCESIYQANKETINVKLLAVAESYYKSYPTIEQCPNSGKFLDWAEAKTGSSKGLPKWLRVIRSEASAQTATLSKRWAPTILEMTWNKKPLFNTGDGWQTADGHITHPSVRGARVHDMFLKDFAEYHESGFIGSPDYVKPLVAAKVSTINWVSLSKRVKGIHTESPDGYPVCMPAMTVNGAVTGRATDPIWQVCPNPKVNRVGTELKSMVAPFPGYSFVGADVDAQEAWLAACHGDQVLGVAGSTPFGLLTIAGNSIDETDIHSVVANQTGYSRDTTKTRVYGCVPMNTEALTKTGWKSYSELVVGDFILAYNEITETNEWSAILAMTYHDDAELIKISNGHNYEHVSTPDHRWYTKQRHRYNRDEMVNVIRTTATIREESNIITAAYSSGGSSEITPDEAAIVAWLITDGSVFWAKPTMKTSSSFGTKRGVQAMVVQKKEMQVSLLYSLLEPYLTKTVGFRSDTCAYTFRLKPQMIRDLWTKAGLFPEAENYVAFVNSLTQPARKAFLEAFWLAEGHVDKKGVKMISQNVGTELESVIVAATLEGYCVRLYWKDSDRKCRTMRMIERQHVTGQKLIKETIKNAPVWCPTTALGTWVMRQGDTVTITGNSIYGQGIKGDSNVIMRSHPTLSEAQANIDSKAFIGLFKGKRVYGNGGCIDLPVLYDGGLASASFTNMERIASVKQPKTPLTAAWMSSALAGIDDYKPTRVNWVVQASGVDFRDMLVLLTNSFYRKLGVDGRLIVTIHDEIRTMVKDADVTKAVYALQLAHLYVRTAFVRAHGLNNIPSGIGWFSKVDVDNICLRKDPLNAQITPTQTALPLGYTMTASQLLSIVSLGSVPLFNGGRHYSIFNGC